MVRDFGGSFSAEHGIGKLKVGELERYASPVELDLMRAVKHAFDPNGILNPGKVLRGVAACTSSCAVCHAADAYSGDPMSHGRLIILAILAALTLSACSKNTAPSAPAASSTTRHGSNNSASANEVR